MYVQCNRYQGSAILSRRLVVEGATPEIRSKLTTWQYMWAEGGRVFDKLVPRHTLCAIVDREGDEPHLRCA